MWSSGFKLLELNMEKLIEQFNKLPIYLQQPASELVFNIENKKYITSIISMFILLEWIARYYNAVYEYRQNPNPDSWKTEDKVEWLDDILYTMNQDLKIHFIKWDNASVLGKTKEYYWLEDDFYAKIKEYFIRYRNKLGHGIYEGIATETYQDERFKTVMLTIKWDKVISTPTTLRKDTLLWWYNEKIYIPIFEWLKNILTVFIDKLTQ